MKKRALCPLSGVHLTIKPRFLTNSSKNCDFQRRGESRAGCYSRNLQQLCVALGEQKRKPHFSITRNGGSVCKVVAVN